MRELVTATIKYLTNHIICHIPSYTIRHLWYRYILGWHIDPDVVILMGLRVQVTGVRSTRKKVRIGKGSIINYECLFQVAGGIIIGEQVSISTGVWLVT